jgi:alpha/beta superfamily hydrolase
MVAAGQGHLLIPVTQWYYAISATSLLDRIDEPDDAWQRAMEADDSPCLMVWGTAESRTAAWQLAYEALDLPSKQAVQIPGSGHYYVGFEMEVTRAVADFVATVVAYCDR